MCLVLVAFPFPIIILIFLFYFSSNTSLNLSKYVFFEPFSLSLSLSFVVSPLSIMFATNWHPFLRLLLFLLSTRYRCEREESHSNGLTIFCRYMGNTDDKLQQLSRSYSLELPMDTKRTPMSLPSMNDLSPRVRYSMSRHRMNLEKANRLSLSSTPMNASQMSLQNRKVSRRRDLVLRAQAASREQLVHSIDQ